MKIAEIFIFFFYSFYSIFSFQREETQVVDPRVIHVMLAAEPTDEVHHFYLT